MKERSKINPLQVAFRGVAKETALYPVLRRQATTDAFGGHERVRELVGQGIGGISVNTHACFADQIWAINSLTDKKGLRSTPVTLPMRKDMAPPGFSLLTSLMGVEILRVVTPTQLKQNKNAKRGEGLSKYIEKSADTIRKGGLVTVAPNAAIESSLTPSKRGVVTKLIKELYDREVADYWIHFTGFDVHGDKYGQDKGLNFFTKYSVNHGRTLTIHEFLNEANVEMIKDEAEDEWKDRSLLNIENVVFNELSKVAAPYYLAQTTETA